MRGHQREPGSDAWTGILMQISRRLRGRLCQIWGAGSMLARTACARSPHHAVCWLPHTAHSRARVASRLHRCRPCGQGCASGERQAQRSRPTAKFDFSCAMAPKRSQNNRRWGNHARALQTPFGSGVLREEEMGSTWRACTRRGLRRCTQDSLTNCQRGSGGYSFYSSTNLTGFGGMENEGPPTCS